MSSTSRSALLIMRPDRFSLYPPPKIHTHTHTHCRLTSMSFKKLHPATLEKFRQLISTYEHPEVEFFLRLRLKHYFFFYRDAVNYYHIFSLTNVKFVPQLFRFGKIIIISVIT